MFSMPFCIPANNMFSNCSASWQVVAMSNFISLDILLAVQWYPLWGFNFYLLDDNTEHLFYVLIGYL